MRSGLMAISKKTIECKESVVFSSPPYKKVIAGSVGNCGQITEATVKNICIRQDKDRCSHTISS